MRRKDEARGRESRRVAAELRVRMADGGCPPDTLLPSQHKLATEFGVSRDTVQRVLRELRGEGWIETRQGHGSSCSRRPSTRCRTRRRQTRGTPTRTSRPGCGRGCGASPSITARRPLCGQVKPTPGPR
ncbi:GntR family transcriptional regulator [Streptomyces collinus Tu 365]|uniref:GntR family transcriptional regulator n=1 Tax=Streptomyces collinus (strain DSM 40733 / Tue 365) TaxID=1214242 RepID=S5UTC9_STRC3|nr:GntR family transcriptional regulator [Streptomyces collinus Tu 365]